MPGLARGIFLHDGPPVLAYRSVAEIFWECCWNTIANRLFHNIMLIYERTSFTRRCRVRARHDLCDALLSYPGPIAFWSLRVGSQPRLTTKAGRAATIRSLRPALSRSAQGGVARQRGSVSKSDNRRVSGATQTAEIRAILPVAFDWPFFAQFPAFVRAYSVCSHAGRTAVS